MNIIIIIINEKKKKLLWLKKKRISHEIVKLNNYLLRLRKNELENYKLRLIYLILPYEFWF